MAAAAPRSASSCPPSTSSRRPANRGGYNFEYSIEVIYAHWASVAALVLLMVACGRTLAAARSGARPPAPEPVGDRPAAATPAGDPVGAGHPSG